MDLLLKIALTLGFLGEVVLSQQFFTPGNDVRCARMWDEIGFEGNTLDCDNNERKTSLGTMDCKAESVFVRNGCTLTVYDKRGCRRTIERSSSCLWGWNRRINSACCECDGCQGQAPSTALSCARLYQNVKCSSCSGFRLEINPWDMVSDLQIFSNAISSLIVKEGCELTVWEGQNYTGNVEIYTGSVDSLLTQGWNDRISSLKCMCQQ